MFRPPGCADMHEQYRWTERAQIYQAATSEHERLQGGLRVDRMGLRERSLNPPRRR
jgi:hypothetical protein